jgi:transcriptional regulator GlxA family with amidase domain
MAEPLRFEAVADAVAMTPRSLARRFEAEMGMTWRMALRHLRVIRSLDHLAGGSTVTQAAFAVGYSSLSAFNAAFREIMDETPTSFSRAVARQAG